MKIVALLLIACTCIAFSACTTTAEDPAVQAAAFSLPPLPEKVPDRPKKQEWSFTKDIPNKQPKDFVIIDGARWRVKRAGDIRVLAQLATKKAKKDHGFALAKNSDWSEFSMTATLKQTSGKGIQGVVWRYQDPRNHYRAWTSGREIRVELVKDGKVTTICSKRSRELLNAFQWHTLEVEHEKITIRVHCNRKLMCELSHPELCAQFEKGQVGLYTQKTAAKFKSLRVDSYATAGKPGI